MESASKIIFGIKQQTLNYLFSEKVGGNGESYIDFLTRLVQIFHTEEYNKALTTEHDVISNKLNYFEQLCEAVKDRIGNATEMTDILKDMRKRELYNEHINSRYLELSTGDIFCIDSSYYLLISQSCDTYLRQDGCRKLENANLLKIECGGQSIHEYPLSCFLDIEGPKVRYQTQISIPFDVLDLCVLNSDGQASIDIAYIQKSDKAKLNRHSMIFLMRLRRICEHIQKIYESKLVLEKFISKDTKVTGEDAKAAYTTLLGENPYLKNYKINETKLCYPVQRICRLNELTTVDIVKGYGTFLSRIGHPFDFLK